MIRYFIIFMLFLLSNNIKAQQFQNPDLNGIITTHSILPTSWLAVPFSDPNCLATNAPGSTPDLTGPTGPLPGNGLNGNPYSGNTFVSGMDVLGVTIYHEGIMQTVSGFTVGCNYNINFQQAVVKQNNLLDTSGSWSVYIDNTLAGTTLPTGSQALPGSNAFIWEPRTVNFIATNSVHTIKFLPVDDDMTKTSTQGLRMGIDSIYISSGNTQLFQNILGNDTSVCNVNNINLNATTANATYVWSNGSTNSILNVNQTGTYWVQITSGCNTIFDTVQVTFNSPPSINLGNDTSICIGNTLMLNATTPNATYLWSNGSSNPTLNITQTGNYWIEATINGCKTSDTINVTFNQPPTINLGNDTSICIGNTLMLNATTPNATYLWSNGSSNPTLNITQTGNYWVEVNVNGCKNIDSIQITFNANPVINIGNDTILCEGENILLNAFLPNANYIWSNNTFSATLNVSQSGNYWVKVSQNNCDFTDYINVQFNPKPTVNLGIDKEICIGSSVELIANSNANNYQWNTNAFTQKITVDQEGTYWVKVTYNNCVNYDTINVFNTQNGCNCNLITPNVFSPNNDLLNDEFRLINTSNIELQTLKIYNRWGNIVFENQNSFDFAWDGKHYSEPCNIGTYYYLIIYKCLITNKTISLKGDITLIR